MHLLSFFALTLFLSIFHVHAQKKEEVCVGAPGAKQALAYLRKGYHRCTVSLI